jgi:predicted CoA-substrate-specific enzyme activase
MILYLCRYAPAEVLEAMGARTEYLEPDDADLSAAESALHPTICSFVKAAFEEIARRNPEGVLLTSCCDSSRRLYDVLKRRYPEKFIYIMELPVRTDAAAVNVYRAAIGDLIRAYEAFGGEPFNAAVLLEKMREKTSLANTQAAGPEAPRAIMPGTPPRLGLTGAKFSPSLLRAIEKTGAEIAFNLSCSGQEHRFEPFAADPTLAAATPTGPADTNGAAANPPDPDEIPRAYARGIFSKYPCMRMVADGERQAGLRRAIEETGADGLLYHTIKFCDNYAYEYAALKGRSPKDRPAVPLLRIETDYAAQSGGQIATRLEAFVEQLKGNTMDGAGNTENNAPDFYIMGLDSGSTSTNAVILGAQKQIIAAAVLPTGPKAANSAAEARALVLKRAGLKEKDIAETVVTGYGRASIPFADKVITEITCHGKGAGFLNKDVRTIIDIGGQDSKVIRIDGNGNIADFAMNDKCAAGTGRFLEMTARSLGAALEEMGAEALTSAEELTISSMCTVFAESEVISLVAENKQRNDILWALCRAIASRNEALLARAGARPPFMMTGGVARNKGVVKALEIVVKHPIQIPDDPEITGALGAALLSDRF